MFAFFHVILIQQGERDFKRLIQLVLYLHVLINFILLTHFNWSTLSLPSSSRFLWCVNAYCAFGFVFNYSTFSFSKDFCMYLTVQ